MNKAYFGTYAALVTPYTHDNKVNYNELQKLVRYLIDNGIDGFYVGGSTAEAFLLSTEERKGCLEAVVEAVNGERNVICHTGSISTDIATELAIHAEKVGANAVSAISPFYYKFSEQEIVQYYKDIMDCVNLPMFIYNFPNFSGFSLTEEILAKLKENKNLAGVKFTSTDMFLLERLKTNNSDLVIWNGFDEMLTAGLMMGADGGIGSTYNCMPQLIHKIYDSFISKDMDGAQKYQVQANHVIKAICKHGVFASVKAILEMDGFCFNGCRKPFSPISDAGLAELKKVYETYILPNRN
ncbi:MAG: N-acetylneuraminate lyase [Clostridia bacterium]|nr:N-acetylneuraminate lyase [Clostridia bacterium]